MKKVFTAVIFVLAVVLIGQRPNLHSQNVRSSPPPTPESKTGIILQNAGQNYQVFLQKILSPERLVLIPNFSEKKSSKTLMQENGCLYGANAGFYTPDNKPLGLFKLRGRYINEKVHSSSLTNGFIYKTTGGFVDIVSQVPGFNIYHTADEFIFQSGPLFTPETKLSIANDKSARRILFAKTKADEFYFMAITESDNTNNGPLLAELPEIINLLNNQLATDNFQLTTLINLDGGSASAYYGEDGKMVSELVPVGSFLCGK